MLSANDEKPSARMIYTEKNYDHKRAKIRIEGKMFGHIPVSIDLTLEDEDSPNSAGVVIDAIRATKTLMDKGNVVDAPLISTFLMKAALVQVSDSDALAKFDDLIK